MVIVDFKQYLIGKKLIFESKNKYSGKKIYFNRWNINRVLSEEKKENHYYGIMKYE